MTATLSGAFDTAKQSLFDEMDEALKFRRLELVPSLLKRGADINQTDRNGNTALILAVIENEPGLVELLIAKDADLEFRSTNGFTAIMYALANQRVDIMRLLTDAGAHVSKAYPIFAHDRNADEIAQMLEEVLETRRLAAEAVVNEKIRQETVAAKQAVLGVKALRHKPKIMAAP